MEMGASFGWQLMLSPLRVKLRIMLEQARQKKCYPDYHYDNHTTLAS